jgi:hypothetical protein
MAGSVSAITCGINKMELFLRIKGRDFRAGPRATNKATMCPEIKQIRKLRSLPQDRANADRLRPGRAIDQVKDNRSYHIREREYLEYPQGRGPALEQDNGGRKNRSRKD